MSGVLRSESEIFIVLRCKLMIDHMLTLQGQTIPVVIWDPVFEIYKIIKSGSGCFFYVYMVGISVKNVHHFIQSTAMTGNCAYKAYQKFTWLSVFVNVVRGLRRQGDAETSVFGRSCYLSKTVTGII